MSTRSYSSIGASKRRGTAHDEIDRSFYTVGQTLASIVNDPRAASQSGGFWGLANEATQLPPPPPLDPTKYPHVSKADLQRYIELVHRAYDKFIKDRQSLEAFVAQHEGRGSSSGQQSSSSGGQQGEPFMVAVQAVPTNFFQESFFDNWDDFFKQYCKEQSAEELYEQIDLLNRNLDVVELQLLREVASRSSSFFQAASSLQVLQQQLSECVGCIRGLRQELAEADQHMYSTAAAVKALQARRENLQDTLDITKGLEEVVAVQSALDVMVEGQDYAGALDLLDQLKALLQQPQLMGLQCLRHLPPRLQDIEAAVDQALAHDFLSRVTNSDIAQIAAQAASDAEAQPDASISPDGTRSSSSTWCLPDPQSTISPAAEEGLQDDLLPLAVGLYRSESLGPTLQQYKVNAGEEVKAGVREVVQQVLPVLLAACGAGSSMTAQQGVGSEVHAWEQLQLLHHGAFMVLLYAAARVIFSCIHHTVLVGKLLENIFATINAPPSQSGPALKACGVAVQVVADVGLGRWVKLLNARSTAHARLKQYELKQILDLSEQVSEYIESVGARPLSSFRTALQGQCKALLEHNHTRCMQQLQGLLEAEQWVAVDVPAGFQAIVDRLLVRCAEGAALLEGRETPNTPTHTRTSSSSGSGSRAGRASAAGEAAPTPTAAAAAGGTEEHQPVLHLCGKSFHLVNSALMLLKMIDEYMTLHDLMPQFGAEIVHRQLEVLKLFNSQTAALVLGAGAMRTAGLRSISAKQLALSCQAIAMLLTLLQPLRAGCLALVSQPRRALLMPEYDRLSQDLTIHVDEVHSKLVDIMRDRLAAAMQALPAEVRAAAPGTGSASVSAPTPTIALLTKQLATLRVVLVPLLLREEVEFVFGAVSRSYSDALSDTFEALLAEPNSGWEPVVQINALTMLEAFRELPLDPARRNNYSARLTTTYTKHFGLPPWDQQRLGHKLQQAAASNSSQQADPLPDQQHSQAEVLLAQPPQQDDEQQFQKEQQQEQQLHLEQQQPSSPSVPEGTAAAAAAAGAAAVAATGAAAAAAALAASSADGSASVSIPDPLAAAPVQEVNGVHDAADAAGNGNPGQQQLHLQQQEPQEEEEHLAQQAHLYHKQQLQQELVQEEQQQHQALEGFEQLQQQPDHSDRQQQATLLLPDVLDLQQQQQQQDQPVVQVEQPPPWQQQELQQQALQPGEYSQSHQRALQHQATPQQQQQQEEEEVLYQQQQVPADGLPPDQADTLASSAAAAADGAAVNSGVGASPVADAEQDYTQQQQQQQELEGLLLQQGEQQQQQELEGLPHLLQQAEQQQQQQTAALPDAVDAATLTPGPVDLLGSNAVPYTADLLEFLESPPDAGSAAAGAGGAAIMAAAAAGSGTAKGLVHDSTAAAAAAIATADATAQATELDLLWDDAIDQPAAVELLPPSSLDPTAAAAAAAAESVGGSGVKGMPAGPSSLPDKASPLDLLDAELQDSLLHDVDLSTDAAGLADAADSTIKQEELHPPLPPQQEQEEELSQQQQQQQRQVSTHQMPELYASLLLPESPGPGSDQNTTGNSDLEPPSAFAQYLSGMAAAAASAPPAADTPAGLVAADTTAAPTPAAAAAPAPSSSWDPLGASTSAPPTEGVVERLSDSGSGSFYSKRRMT